MEFFKYLLFGITGGSLIFWVCVIALWHTYMFPRLFSEDRIDRLSTSFLQVSKAPVMSPSGLFNRSKYSNKSFVIADFNPVEADYGVNRLFTLMLFSLAIMTFIIITYGLHSGFMLYGIQ